jgi:hypothetical protein
MDQLPVKQNGAKTSYTQRMNKENREKLQQIADIGGDLMLNEMLWDMFEDLSLVNQKHYIARAARIVKRETGIEWKPE